MQLIKVRGRWTLEIERPIHMYFSSQSHIEILAKTDALPEERDYYHELAALLDAAITAKQAEDPTTRQATISDPRCIAYIHFLGSRGYSTLITAHLRSSDLARLPSDLGFLARLALAYKAKLDVTLDALHVYLAEEGTK